MSIRAARRAAVAALALTLAACAQTPPPDLAASLAAPEAPAEPAPVEAAGYQITGETFGAELVFQEVDGRAVARFVHAVDAAPVVEAELQPDPAWLADGVQRFTGLSDRGLPIVVELESGPCQAGGRRHARFVTIETGRLTHHGCARETGPQLSWTEALHAYLPAIERCLDQASRSSMAFVRGSGEARVLHAGVVDGDVVARFQFGDVGRWECLAAGPRPRWSVVPDAAPEREGEGAPVFVPGMLPEGGDGCYLYERVRTQDGALIGALGHDVCAGGMANLDAPIGSG